MFLLINVRLVLGIMKAFLKDKKEVAEKTLWFRYKLEKAVDFKPGQIFFITIPKLKYKDDTGNTRHFSIVNSPSENNFIEMATRMTGSGFKETLKELPIGSEVEIGSISGEFTLPEEMKRSLVFIAGGIGITPFMSMLRFIKEEVLPYKVILFFSNKNRQTAPFLEELEKISNENIYFKFIPAMTEDKEWTGETGRIDEEMLRKHLTDLNSYSYFIAGPPLFNQAVREILEKVQVEKDNMKVENFSGYTTMYGIKD